MDKDRERETNKEKERGERRESISFLAVADF